MGVFRWHWRHRSDHEHHGNDLANMRKHDWIDSIDSAAKAIDAWPDSPRIKDWNLRQLAKRRTLIESGREKP